MENKAVNPSETKDKTDNKEVITKDNLEHKVISDEFEYVRPLEGLELYEFKRNKFKDRMDNHTDYTCKSIGRFLITLPLITALLLTIMPFYYLSFYIVEPIEILFKGKKKTNPITNHTFSDDISDFVDMIMDSVVCFRNAKFHYDSSTYAV